MPSGSQPSPVGADPAGFATCAAGRVLAGLAVWAPVTAFLGFTLFPVYWLVNSSLKGPGELITFLPPRVWYLTSNGDTMWCRRPYGFWFSSSDL